MSFLQHVDNLKIRFLDIARPNMFEILIDTSRLGLTQPGNEMIRAAVKTTSFPSVTVGDLGLTRMGVKYPLPGDVSWGESSVTFFNDANFKIFDFFQEWRRMYLRQGINNQGGVPKNALAADVKIVQLYGNHEQAKICTLKHAWPSVIGDIQLDHESENASESFQVTFSYVYANWSRTLTENSSGISEDSQGSSDSELSDIQEVPVWVEDRITF